MMTVKSSWRSGCWRRSGCCDHAQLPVVEQGPAMASVVVLMSIKSDEPSGMLAATSRAMRSS